MRLVLDERARFIGQPRHAWHARLAAPWSVAIPRYKLQLAARVLDRLAADRVRSKPHPRDVRAVVFRTAAAQPDTASALAASAAQLGIDTEAIARRLFADLPDERELTGLPPSLSPSELALSCNEVLVCALLHRALFVRVRVYGNARAVVRHAKLMGLVCILRPAAAKDAVELEISGPYTLFRHTRVYGRALASLLPRLARCHRFALEADCPTDRGAYIGRLSLRSGDPIAPARELPAFDSQVEERFARAFGALALTWDLVREPRPVRVGEKLIFPDFELVQRDTGARWLLEIVGYWTPEYVSGKLQDLQAAGLERVIVCIDEARACVDCAVDLGPHVVRYRRHVDPRAVLALVDPALARRLAATHAHPNAKPRKRGKSAGGKARAAQDL